MEESEITELMSLVKFPVSKSLLVDILYQNKFSEASKNAVYTAAMDTFNSIADVQYAISHYSPNVI